MYYMIDIDTYIFPRRSSSSPLKNMKEDSVVILLHVLISELFFNNVPNHGNHYLM